MALGRALLQDTRAGGQGLRPGTHPLAWDRGQAGARCQSQRGAAHPDRGRRVRGGSSRAERDARAGCRGADTLSRNGAEQGGAREGRGRAEGDAGVHAAARTQTEQTRPAPDHSVSRRRHLTGCGPLPCPLPVNFSRLNCSMVLAAQRLSRHFHLIAAGLALLAASAALPTARAQGTRLWTQSRMEDFEKGSPQGVALSSDGMLREAPGLREIVTTPSTFVWSVDVDKHGTAYLGTGSPATVLRVGADGKAVTLFETHDLSVQVVRLGPDGSLYAATLPSGKVYRLRADATAKQDETSAPVV